jgi:hypothetical protein
MPENGYILRCIDTWRSYSMCPGLNIEVTYSVMEGIRKIVELLSCEEGYW